MRVTLAILIGLLLTGCVPQGECYTVIFSSSSDTAILLNKCDGASYLLMRDTDGAPWWRHISNARLQLRGED
jgi:hypothetical protein